MGEEEAIYNARVEEIRAEEYPMLKGKPESDESVPMCLT
jgi:hypothetical protein